jgi:hypothetical protein
VPSNMTKIVALDAHLHAASCRPANKTCHGMAGLTASCSNPKGVLYECF